MAPKLLHDEVILQLLEPEVIQHIRHYPAVDELPETARMRTHVVLRSRYAEDVLQQAYEKGIRQYIILGAGFDTFAHRQPEWTKDLQPPRHTSIAHVIV